MKRSKRGDPDRSRKKESKQKRRRADKVLSKDPQTVVAKLQKWAEKGKHAKLEEVLEAAGEAAAAALIGSVRDVWGRSLLHSVRAAQQKYCVSTQHHAT
jgi:hypothetical protein